MNTQDNPRPARIGIRLKQERGRDCILGRDCMVYDADTRALLPVSELVIHVGANRIATAGITLDISELEIETID